MGLFDNFLGDAINTVTLGGARAIGGKGVGTTNNFLEGAGNALTLGAFDGNANQGTAPQFNPDTSIFDQDIDRIRQLGQKDISGLRGSANIQLDQLSDDKRQLLSELAKRQSGQLGGSLDRLASQGGLSGGASERLAQKSNRDSLFAGQNIGSDFSRLSSDVRARDFAGQEDLKNRALFSTPGLQAQSQDIGIRSDAANQRARALFDENKRQSKRNKLSSLFSLGGAAIGGVAGGVPGARLGAGIGGATAGLFN